MNDPKPEIIIEMPPIVREAEAVPHVINVEEIEDYDLLLEADDEHERLVEEEYDRRHGS